MASVDKSDLQRKKDEEEAEKKRRKRGVKSGRVRHFRKGSND